MVFVVFEFLGARSAMEIGAGQHIVIALSFGGFRARTKFSMQTFVMLHSALHGDINASMRY